ncbi:hypothetical protein [Methylomonas koyamae]|uniref:hypothetical protein n=1 Tax=Methylomonas koyamae TaxID=702114 RepID=UPI000AC5BE7F|nr:hypothetical protein [Methylomonas koyamae]
MKVKAKRLAYLLARNPASVSQPDCPRGKAFDPLNSHINQTETALNEGKGCCDRRQRSLWPI